MLIRALCLVAVASCSQAKADPPPQLRFEHDMMVRFHMHENFDLLRAIEKLLVRGRLEEARTFAKAMSEAPDEPGLGAWTQHAILVRDRAARLAEARTTEDACRRAAELADACARCHVDAGVMPEFRSAKVPPDHPTIEARMTRHLWATDRLWEGIVGGADDSWRDGLEVLAATPLRQFETGDPRLPIARRLQTLADQARKQPRETEDRARSYGEILVTCASCHTTAKPADPH